METVRRLELLVPCPDTSAAEQLEALEVHLSDHFGAIRCADHADGPVLELTRSSSGLALRLDSCCRSAAEVAERHLPCAAEIAAIYGLALEG